MNATETALVQVIDSQAMRRPLALIDGEGSAYAVLHPDNGGKFRTVNLIDVEAGSATIELRHSAECVYYIARGNGVIRDAALGTCQDLIPGSMIHIGPGDAYRLEAGQDGLYAIGGCVPADPALYDYLIESSAE